ncbi:MAG: hypothetical protein JRG80_11165 [Deltaproteobacteria bacterium]|nr:hypothetical protein [Deltaproteobacteria bacterium]
MAKQPLSGMNSKSDETRNPHHRMHRVIYWITVVFLTAQVIEGSLVVPYVLVYFGFPQLGLVEICSEMQKIAYADEERVCQFPVPLFSSPEPWNYPSRAERFGPSTPPQPDWELPGFRGIIEQRREREARRALLESSGTS